jgi:hypothetical protein
VNAADVATSAESEHGVPPQERVLKQETERLGARVAELRKQAGALEEAARGAEQTTTDARLAFARGEIVLDDVDAAARAGEAASIRLATVRGAIATIEAAASAAEAALRAAEGGRQRAAHAEAAEPLRQRADELVREFAERLVAAIKAPALLERKAIIDRIATEYHRAQPIAPMEFNRLVDAVKAAFPEEERRDLHPGVPIDPGFSEWLGAVLAGPPPLRAGWRARLRDEFHIEGGI